MGSKTMIKVIWIFTVSFVLFRVDGVLEDAVFSSNMVPIDNRGERVWQALLLQQKLHKSIQSVMCMAGWVNVITGRLGPGS